MATINEITQGSQYTGNANLGGGNFGVGQLDTKPIEDLARYTFLYNKAEYDQRQKDAESAANEIADLVRYDLTSGIPKDAKVLQDKYDKMISYINENPDAMDYRNKEKWAKWKSMRNDIENDIRGGKVRSTLYEVRKKEISEAKTQVEKDWLQTQLDKNIDETDIRTPIQHTPEYDTSLPEMPKGGELSFDVMQKGPNQIYDREHKMFNISKARAMSNVYAMGLGDEPDESTLEGQRKAMARKSNFWVNGSAIFNQALAGYKDANNQIDESKVKGMARDIYALVKETNNYMVEKRNEIKAGVYKDKMGRDINFGTGALKEDDYREINVEDGISPDEMALVAAYASWKGDGYDTKVIQTNDQIEMARIAETARHNKAGEGIARDNLKLEQDKWKTSQTGGETVKNGAMIKAQRIYSDMKKLADENGVISPDKVRQLDQEQLKYLGIETISESEGGVKKSVFTPLSLEGEVAIQLVDGRIKVLNPKDEGGKIIKLPSGRYEGVWDNTKSTNIFNVATNILNEQLKNAGAKELNAYLPIDLATGGVSTNTTGGATSTSAGSTKKEINRGDIATKAAASGYTPKEYEALLKKNGIIIKD